jgi:hypothetical protein
MIRRLTQLYERYIPVNTELFAQLNALIAERSLAQARPLQLTAVYHVIAAYRDSQDSGAGNRST